MIGEFAFTPSVFDEQANPDAESWREHLRKLGDAMFPMTAARPVMVANLYDESWYAEAKAAAEAVKEDKSRILCLDILKRINDMLVRRPIAVNDWPADDAAWCREAIASHASEPIDRIVSCRAVQDMLSSEEHPVRCISEVHGDGFWREISTHWGQQMTIPSQIQAVRKLTLHAEFLCLITPHVQGGSDDETEFTKELIRSSLRRPNGYPAVEIEVHTKGPEKPEDLARVVSNVSKSLLPVLPPHKSVRLVHWPKLLDRYLIAGVYTSSTRGTRMRSPRWGLSMSHIARNGDTRPPTPWSLLMADQLGDVFNLHCTGAPTKPLSDVRVYGQSADIRTCQW